MKKALVTGGSGGIGSAICRALAAEGYYVFVGCHDHTAEAEALAAELGGQAIRADVRSPEETAAMMEAVGTLAVLVNCAGVDWMGLLQDMTEEEWRDIFAVNVDGVYRCTRAAIPGMVRRREGCIINISSILGLTGSSYETAYSATKGALVTMTKALAKELGPSGIRVNCVCPGCVRTLMMEGFSPLEERDLIDRTVLGRIGEPREIADAVAFLASDKASFITGQAIAVDGGFLV